MNPSHQKEYLNIYWAKVPFVQNYKKSKYRPIVLLKNQGNYAKVLEVTSKYHGKSPYLKLSRYPIRHYHQAGLYKPSYVNLDHVISMKRGDIKNHRIGYLNRNECLHMFTQGMKLHQAQFLQFKTGHADIKFHHHIYHLRRPKHFHHWTLTGYVKRQQDKKRTVGSHSPLTNRHLNMHISGSQMLNAYRGLHQQQQRR